MRRTVERSGWGWCTTAARGDSAPAPRGPAVGPQRVGGGFRHMGTLWNKIYILDRGGGRARWCILPRPYELSCARMAGCFRDGRIDHNVTTSAVAARSQNGSIS